MADKGRSQWPQARPMFRRLLIPCILIALLLGSSDAVRAASASVASAAYSTFTTAELSPQRTKQKGRAQQGKGGKAKAKGKAKGKGKKGARRGPVGGKNRVGPLAGSDDLFRPPVNPPLVATKPEPTEEDPYVLPGVAIAADEQIAEWHGSCDYDLNGRVSYSEAHMALGFDRARFQLYDKDRDGLFALEEFDTHYRDSLRFGNSFRLPAAAPERGRAPVRTPEQVRNAYDSDLDSFIDVEELVLIIEDYERPDLEAAQVLSGVDVDQDQLLNLDELAGLNEILNPVAIQPIDDMLDKPKSLVELFGAEIPRGTESVGPPQPPLIIGPLPHFIRLDADGDGLISVEDLEKLLRPLQIPVRITTVLNTLDLDGDGKLSHAEMVQALE